MILNGLQQGKFHSLIFDQQMKQYCIDWKEWKRKTNIISEHYLSLIAMRSQIFLRNPRPLIYLEVVGVIQNAGKTTLRSFLSKNNIGD